MRFVLLVLALVVVVVVVYSRSDTSSTPAASSGCESKKRDFVSQIPQMTTNRQPPQGMFISGGGFPPDVSILVVEGNGLWAQVLYDKATNQPTTWNVLCR